MQRFRSFALVLTLLAVSSAIGAMSPYALAQTEDEIKSQIEEHSDRIQALEAEIQQYQRELNVVSGQKQTLQSAINSLDITRKQTSAEIALTENSIARTNLQLDRLSYDIEDTEDVIELDQEALEESIRVMASSADTTIVEQLFAAGDLTEAWGAVDDAAALNDALRANVAELSEAKRSLSAQLQDVDAKKSELTGLRNDLDGQRQTLDATRREKDSLLSQTKNQESAYQSLIAQKQAERKIFEQALSSLENSLASVGQGAAPASQTGVLAWPYSSAFAESCVGKSGALGNTRCITQYFGNTAFATANSQIYNGSGHNAIDIGMPSGTPVLAALSGTVIDTGNTDSVPGCYSFGKWVAVRHANGLSTTYNHLSTISVSPGQSVSTGQQVGLSGMTGYATGPHLHFAVYASAGLQIMTLGQYRGATTPCANAKMPVAPKDAYLNPMSYL